MLLLWNVLSIILPPVLFRPSKWNEDCRAGGHPELKKGREWAKLGNCILTANLNRILIIAMICQIFAPKYQLIRLSFKLSKRKPSPRLTFLLNQPNSARSTGRLRAPPHPQWATVHRLPRRTAFLPTSPPAPSSSGPCTRPTPLPSFKIQFMLHVCTEPSLPSIVF